MWIGVFSYCEKAVWSIVYNISNGNLTRYCHPFFFWHDKNFCIHFSGHTVSVEVQTNRRLKLPMALTSDESLILFLLQGNNFNVKQLWVIAIISRKEQKNVLQEFYRQTIVFQISCWKPYSAFEAGRKCENTVFYMKIQVTRDWNHLQDLSLLNSVESCRGEQFEGWSQDCSNSNIFLKPLFRGNFDPFVNNAV